MFDAWYDAAAITALMKQIATDAGQPHAQVWPSRQVIRLPFGFHQRAHTFGTLILQTGETLHLDDDAQRAAGWAAVLALPFNSAPPPLPELAPAPAPRPIERLPLRMSPGEAGAARLSLGDVRARFNAEHTLDELLTHYGATRTPDGYTCSCGVQHTHETTLSISRQGRLFSFSPRCNLHIKHGWDAFGLYVTASTQQERRALTSSFYACAQCGEQLGWSGCGDGAARLLVAWCGADTAVRVARSARVNG